jgi:hypothetical protein
MAMISPWFGTAKLMNDIRDATAQFQVKEGHEEQPVEAFAATTAKARTKSPSPQASRPAGK